MSCDRCHTNAALKGHNGQMLCFDCRNEVPLVPDQPVELTAQRAIAYLKGLIWTIDHNEVKGIAHQISCDQEEIASLIAALEAICKS